MTQADVAREMGVSRQRVSQILRGNDNLTLKSIVAVAIALDARVEVRLRPATDGGKGAAGPTGRGQTVTPRPARSPARHRPAPRRRRGS